MALSKPKTPGTGAIKDDYADEPMPDIPADAMDGSGMIKGGPANVGPFIPAEPTTMGPLNPKPETGPGDMGPEDPGEVPGLPPMPDLPSGPGLDAGAEMGDALPSPLPLSLPGAASGSFAPPGSSGATPYSLSTNANVRPASRGGAAPFSVGPGAPIAAPPSAPGPGGPGGINNDEKARQIVRAFMTRRG